MVAGTALANCQTVPFRFSDIAANPVVHTSGATNGAPCEVTFTSKTIIYETSSIARAPRNGKLDKKGLVSFIYTPRKGFKGDDVYAIKICGKDDRTQATGCLTAHYAIEVR